MEKLLAKHIGEIAEHLEEVHKEQRLLIDSLENILKEWEGYFNEDPSQAHK